MSTVGEEPKTPERSTDAKPANRDIGTGIVNDSPLVKTLLRRWHDDDRLRFLVVGGFNFAFGYAAFVLLFLALGGWLHYAAVAVLAQVVAVAVAFFMQRTLVFRKTGSFGLDLVRFTVSVTGVFLLNLGLLALLVEAGGAPPLVAQTIVVAVAVVVTYLAHRFFSFRRGK